PPARGRGGAGWPSPPRFPPGPTRTGAPMVGWVADRFGPRWALGLGAASGFAAAIVGIHYLRRYGKLRLRIEAGRPRFRIDDSGSMRNSPLRTDTIAQ